MIVMEHVTVLMSTYNGEKYLREQLESIFNQKNVHVRMIVRDDGSDDHTVDILREYQQKYSDMKIILDGEKKYACMSFLSLITEFSDDDYFALADQDDIWDFDKLECAIAKLKNEDENQILLYFSNLKIVDSEGEFYRLSHDTERNTCNKYSSLIDNQVTGCTAVYNRKLAEFVNGRKPKDFSMHDAYLFIVASFFGKVVYDSKAHISYRQHGNNTIGANLQKPKTRDVLKRGIKRIFNRKLQPRKDNAKQFYAVYSDLLNDIDKEKVRELADYKKSLSSRIKLLLDKDFSSFSNKKTLFFKVLVLLGNA